MNRSARIPAIVLAAAVLAAGLACTEDGPTSAPEALPVTVELTSPNEDDGAILLAVTGGSVDAASAVSGDAALYSGSTGGSTLVAVVGNVTSGPLFEFEAEGGSGSPDYFVEIVEVSDRDNLLRDEEDLEAYDIELQGS